MIFIGILGLIIIGPKQLPEVARNIGRLLNELKQMSGGFWSDISAEAKPPRPPAPASPPVETQFQQTPENKKEEGTNS